MKQVATYKNVGIYKFANIPVYYCLGKYFYALRQKEGIEKAMKYVDAIFPK